MSNFASKLREYVVIAFDREKELLDFFFKNEGYDFVGAFHMSGSNCRLELERESHDNYEVRYIPTEQYIDWADKWM